jgi:hypothetical protein
MLMFAAHFFYRRIHILAEVIFAGQRNGSVQHGPVKLVCLYMPEWLAGGGRVQGGTVLFQ